MSEKDAILCEGDLHDAEGTQAEFKVTYKDNKFGGHGDHYLCAVCLRALADENIDIEAVDNLIKTSSLEN